MAFEHYWLWQFGFVFVILNLICWFIFFAREKKTYNSLLVFEFNNILRFTEQQTNKKMTKIIIQKKKKRPDLGFISFLCIYTLFYFFTSLLIPESVSENRRKKNKPAWKNTCENSSTLCFCLSLTLLFVIKVVQVRQHYIFIQFYIEYTKIETDNYR